MYKSIWQTVPVISEGLLFELGPVRTDASHFLNFFGGTLPDLLKSIFQILGKARNNRKSRKEYYNNPFQIQSSEDCKTFYL